MPEYIYRLHPARADMLSAGCTADEEAARVIVAADPAVAQGVMTAELFPFRIVFGGDS